MCTVIFVIYVMLCVICHVSCLVIYPGFISTSIVGSRENLRSKCSQSCENSFNISVGHALISLDGEHAVSEITQLYHLYGTHHTMQDANGVMRAIWPDLSWVGDGWWSGSDDRDCRKWTSTASCENGNVGVDGVRVSCSSVRDILCICNGSIPTPTVISPVILEISDVAMGAWHTCVTLSNGNVYCVGDNSFGQFGQVIPGYSAHPRRVQNMSMPSKITSGGIRSAALMDDCSVMMWGLSYTEAIEAAINGIVTDPSPRKIYDCASNVYITEAVICIIDIQNTMFCKGENTFGQLGIGYASESVATFTQVQNETIDMCLGYQFTCALSDTRNVFCWGELNAGTMSVSSTTPIPVDGAVDVVQLACGIDRVCGIHVNGSVSCWGHGKHITIIQDIPPVKSIVLGDQFTCALTTSLTVYCWGSIGSTQSITPVEINMNAPVNTLYSTHDAVCGNVNGTLWCWGDNMFGKLGTRIEGNHDSPQTFSMMFRK